MIGVGNRKGLKIESKDFSSASKVVGEDYSHSRLDWIYAKEVEFEDCDFSSSSIKSCYFRKATFKKCKFIGCSISDSNFRGAKFSQCKFEYVSIRNTHIDVAQIIANQPEWENASRDLFRSLRKNAESVGNLEDVRECLDAEMDASAEHWRAVYQRRTPYYKAHYPGAWAKASALLKWRGIKFGKWFWGYGDRPLNLFFSGFIWIVVLSLLSWRSPGIAGFLEAFKNISAVFFGSPAAAYSGISDLFAIAVVASRYVFVGLFSAVLVRRFARR